MKVIGGIIGILIYMIVLAPIWIMWFSIKTDINGFVAIMFVLTLCLCMYPANKLQTKFYDWYKSHLKD